MTDKLVIYNANRPKAFAVLPTRNQKITERSMKVAETIIHPGPYLAFYLNDPSTVLLLSWNREEKTLSTRICPISYEGNLKQNVSWIVRMIMKYSTLKGKRISSNKKGKK